MSQTLDNVTRERIRYHCGYLDVQPAAAITYGTPAPVQTLFLIENAMNLLLPEAIPRVYNVVQILDDIECQMVQGQAYLPANKLGELEIRKEHIDMLEDEYFRWASRLADILGIPLYPFSERFMGRRKGRVNVPVSG